MDEPPISCCKASNLALLQGEVTIPHLLPPIILVEGRVTVLVKKIIQRRSK